MSGPAFRRVIEIVRPHLKARIPDEVERVYEPQDGGCLGFISVEKLGITEFNAFVLAIEAAFREDLQSNPDPSFAKLWEEILQLSNADPRRRRSV